jgi:hypothetical protein
MMRASIPALTILLILALRAVDEMSAASALQPHALLLFTVLGIGGFTAVYEFWRAISHEHWRPDYSRTLRDAARGSSMPNYLGKLDRPDLKAILKPASPVAPRR